MRKISLIFLLGIGLFSSCRYSHTDMKSQPEGVPEVTQPTPNAMTEPAPNPPIDSVANQNDSITPRR